jgi:tetratricopeptide (TPR) repeat protein
MKKFMMMALMVAAASGACAQDNLWKKAQSLCDADKTDEAIQVITPCLNSDQTQKKADAWNTMANIYFAVLKRESAKMQNKEKPQPYDTAVYHKAVVGALTSIVECDKYDSQPSEKGKVKPRFHKDNAQRLLLNNIRPQIINSALFANNHNDTLTAYKDFALYVESGKEPIVKEITTGSDQYIGQISYYASLLAYQLGKYNEVNKYINYALADSTERKQAVELQLFTYKEMKDSDNYIKAVKAAYEKYPSESKYFDWIVNYYMTKSDLASLTSFADQEIAKDPNNKTALYSKGVVLMQQKNWDLAVENFKKAIAIEPNFYEANFNAGVCLNSKGSEMRDKLADKRGGLTTVNYNKIIAVEKESLLYLEKARTISPDRSDQWAYPLYTVYYTLKDNRYKDMEKYLKK